MNENVSISYRDVIKFGLIAGAVALSISVIGMIELFGERDMIAGVFTLGQVFLFSSIIAMTYLVSNKLNKGEKRQHLLYGLTVGFIASLPLVLLVIVASNFDVRQFLVNVSPALIELLTFNQGLIAGSILLVVVFSLVGVLTAAFQIIPERYTRPLLTPLIWTLGVGLFSELLSVRLRAIFGKQFIKLLFESNSLLPIAAIIIFVLVAAFTAWWEKRKLQREDQDKQLTEDQLQKRKWVRWGMGGVLLLVLPLILGSYLSEVVNNVGLYILMGIGLNIVVGFAGLLDLGYVAFFAIGAYSMAILTSTGDYGLFQMSFWAALPICVVVSVLFGIILGVPVLRMRGDYLAIVTLGFGEIIRVLALSDFLKPYIGGAQGLLKIPKPRIGTFSFVKPEMMYYVILVCVLIAAFISWRLQDARLGRRWMALREDEDVAEAMGINLVSTKLLAFGIGAAFSGMAGAIFASKLTSIFPHSIKLEVSIWVLCLIIVGGIGNLPGVIVGAFVLIGLPELLREFAEYRLLMYGALLITMMLAKPEGFIPSAVRKRELLSYKDAPSVSSD